MGVAEGSSPLRWSSIATFAVLDRLELFELVAWHLAGSRSPPLRLSSIATFVALDRLELRFDELVVLAWHLAGSRSLRLDLACVIFGLDDFLVFSFEANSPRQSLILRIIESAFVFAA